MRPLRPLSLAGMLIAASIVPGWGQADPSTARVHFVYVGQGDAAVLEFSCGIVLIDAGGQNDETTAGLVRYLHDVFARRPELGDTIQAVFITHNHVDHNRALPEVVRTFRVQRVIENGQRGGSTRDHGDAAMRWLETNAPASLRLAQIDDAEVVQTTAGLTGPDIDPVECAGTDPDIRILSADLAENPGWPFRAFTNKNNHSLVIRIDFGAASFLFTGDLEEDAIATLVEYYAGSGLLDTDVYQVGHHGSHNGTTTDLLDAIARPEIAVLSMSRCDDRRTWTGWRYGHPREVTVDQLQRAIVRRRQPRSVNVARGAMDFYTTTMRDAIYGTGWDGTVVVHATADGMFRVVIEGAPVPTGC